MWSSQSWFKNKEEYKIAKLNSYGTRAFFWFATATAYRQTAVFQSTACTIADTVIRISPRGSNVQKCSTAMYAV